MTGLERHYSRCDPRAETEDPTDGSWHCRECGEQLTGPDPYVQLAHAMQGLLDKLTEALRLPQLAAWIDDRATDDQGRHRHWFAVHRHPDWHGHPRPDRWHAHGPYRHRHEETG